MTYIRLHVARSYTSSPDSPFSFIPSFTLSNHLLLGLPLPLPSPLYFHFHRPPSYVVFLSSHHMRIPLQPPFLDFSCNFPHSRCPLIISFLILSSFVTLHFHRSIRISVTSNVFSCAFFNAHVAAPYASASLTTVQLHVNVVHTIDFAYICFNYKYYNISQLQSLAFNYNYISNVDKGFNIIVHSEKPVQLLVNDVHVLSYIQLQITIIPSLIHMSHAPAPWLSLVVHCIDYRSSLYVSYVNVLTVSWSLLTVSCPPYLLYYHSL